jgi:hypothetical protein
VRKEQKDKELKEMRDRSQQVNVEDATGSTRKMEV